MERDCRTALCWCQQGLVQGQGSQDGNLSQWRCSIFLHLYLWGLAKFQESPAYACSIQNHMPWSDFLALSFLKGIQWFLEGWGWLVFLEVLTPSSRLGPGEGMGSLILSLVCHSGWTGRRSPSSGFLKLSLELMWEGQWWLHCLCFFSS